MSSDKRLPYYLFRTIFVLVIPFSIFLLSWWISYFFTKDEKVIELSVIIGMFVGLGTFCVAFVKWKANIYTMPVWLLLIIYLFYSVCVFGFFMGFPLFYPIVGSLAGYYWAERLLACNMDKKEAKSEIRKICIFTASSMGIVSIASSFLALTDKYIESEISGMLNLSFEIRRPLLAIAIIAGAVFLVMLQYWLTGTIMKKVIYGNTNKIRQTCQDE